MSRKSQQKSARKVSKRKMRTPRAHRFASPLPAAAPTHPVIKISEAILKLAEPLRAYYKEPHRLQAIISMAVMAWNISLFPDEEHVHLQGMLLESLPAQAQEGDETAVVNTS